MVYSQKYLTKKTENKLKDAEFSENKTGHRKRVKDRFLKHDISSFASYEIIEALLFFCNPRKDVKPEAKILDKLTNGNMLKFLAITPEILKQYNIKYIADNLLFLNKVMHEILARATKEKVSEFIFKNTKDISNYLIVRSGFLSKEELRILYLNAKNRLIEDEVLSKGTVNETAIYVREIASRALNKNATAVIISHNHPSGDFSPSREDVKITYTLKQALEIFSIALQDHIIVSEGNFFSFKTNGLL